MRAGVALLFATLLASGCGQAPEAGPASASASTRSLSSAPRPPSSSAQAAAEEELSTRPVEILKLRLTSGISNKEPVDALDHATPGQRVYAHLTVRNRTGRARQVHVAFTVDGKVRSAVDLKVEESWSWRTWAFVTLKDSDKPGKLEIAVTDDEGLPLEETSLPIKK